MKINRINTLATEPMPNSFGTANAVLLVEAHKPIATVRFAGPTPTGGQRPKMLPHSDRRAALNRSTNQN